MFINIFSKVQMGNLYHLSDRPEILHDKFGFLILLLCLKEGLNFFPDLKKKQIFQTFVP